MRGLRTAAFVAALLIVAACGSSATPVPGTSAAPSSAAASEAPAQSEVPAASESTGPAASTADFGIYAGTGTITFDGKSGALDSGTCVGDDYGGIVVVAGGTVGGDKVGLTLDASPDNSHAALAGTWGDAIWGVTANPQVTLNADKTGTFSGKDGISGADVSGTFACK